MNKRFSFAITATIVVIITVGFVSIPYWIFDLLGLTLPNWLNPMLTITGLYIALDIASRIGPQSFETPLDRIKAKKFRDKVVIIGAYVLSFSLFGYLRDHQGFTFWYRLFAMVIVLLLIYVFALIFATPDFRQELLPERFRRES